MLDKVQFLIELVILQWIIVMIHMVFYFCTDELRYFLNDVLCMEM